jgi:hypothetical protein
MKKDKDIKFPNAIQTKFGFRGYEREASRFWMGRDFETDFGRGKEVDYTKLAAAQRAIGNFVNIVTGKQIPVVFQSNDSSYTDGERVVIGTKLDDKNFDPAVGLALHEGSHIAYTDFKMFKNPGGGYASSLSGTKMAQIARMNGVDPEMSMTERDFATIKDLLNWIEDRRIDYKIYTAAPGYRMYYEAMYNKYFNDKIIDTALVTGEKTDEDWDCYMFHIINLTNPNRQLDSIKQLRTIWNLIDLRNIDRLKDTNDALLLAIEVYRAIKAAVGHAPSEKPSTQAPMGNNSTGMPGQPGDSDAKPEDGEPSDEEGNPGNQGGGGDEEDENKEETERPKMSQKDAEKLAKAIQAQREFLSGEQKKQGRLSKADSAIVNALRESGTETRTVYTNKAGDGCPIHTVVIKKLTPAIVCSLPNLFASYSKEVVNGERQFGEKTHEIFKMNEAVTRGIILGKQLGNKLQLRNADRTLKSTRLVSGKIDRRLVSQLGYNNANVFHRIVTDRYKNYFIHISIDASGSMGGQKLHQAITSAVAIAQAAAMTTGIRVQISLRGTANLSTGKEQAVTVYAYDSATDKLSKIRNMFRYLSTFGCTPEGVALKSIENDIKTDAKGDELILINYSDGAPTTVSGVDYYFDPVDFTRRVVNGMREVGFNIVSYFIKSGNYAYDSDEQAFKKMYGPDAQFIEPENMHEVSKTMNKKFLEMAQ